MRGEKITGDPEKDRIEESDDSDGDQDNKEGIIKTFKPEPQNA
jgi:cell division protease FtsH